MKRKATQPFIFSYVFIRQTFMMSNPPCHEASESVRHNPGSLTVYDLGEIEEHQQETLTRLNCVAKYMFCTLVRLVRLHAASRTCAFKAFSKLGMN